MDYEVIAPIRSGGMATLYLARRHGVGGFSRLVALKLIHPHLLQDDAIIGLFLDEARISAGVRHPNVVHVEEVGVHQGTYFIAMEYVHGVTLAQFLCRLEEKRLRLSPKLCVWIAAQIAEALHAAHEAYGENGAPLNIVHRDVSPQNILIGHTGHVKLIDFGIAKSRISSHAVSRDGSILGKLRYMSPEQLRLDPVSRRSDLYAMGVMLWEMLACRDFLRCHRIDDPRDWETRERPPPPSRHMAGISPALDRVVLKALAYEPEKRFATAFHFRRALLRADSAAALIDAPRVAALLQTLLGDELDRRKLNWPSEVTRELELSSPAPAVREVHELTVKVDGSGTENAHSSWPAENRSGITPAPGRALGATYAASAVRPLAKASAAGMDPSAQPDPDEEPTVMRPIGEALTDFALEAPPAVWTHESVDPWNADDDEHTIARSGLSSGQPEPHGPVDYDEDVEDQTTVAYPEHTAPISGAAPTTDAPLLHERRSIQTAVLAAACLGLGLLLGVISSQPGVHGETIAMPPASGTASPASRLPDPVSAAPSRGKPVSTTPASVSASESSGGAAVSLSGAGPAESSGGGSAGLSGTGASDPSAAHVEAGPATNVEARFATNAEASSAASAEAGSAANAEAAAANGPKAAAATNAEAAAANGPKAAAANTEAEAANGPKAAAAGEAEPERKDTSVQRPQKRAPAAEPGPSRAQHKADVARARRLRRLHSRDARRRR